MTKKLLKGSQHSRVCVSVLLLTTVAIFQTSSAAGQTGRYLGTTNQSAEAPKKNALPAPAQPKLPDCPKTVLATPQVSADKAGHHTVTLTWKPSSPANQEQQTAGYCLYRSQKQDIPSDISKCHDCEQINAIAVSGAGCVDDLVQDGATYYYVVTHVVMAANGKERISLISKEARAQIPPDKESVKPAATGSYPLCRAQ